MTNCLDGLGRIIELDIRDDEGKPVLIPTAVAFSSNQQEGLFLGFVGPFSSLVPVVVGSFVLEVQGQAIVGAFG